LLSPVLLQPWGFRLQVIYIYIYIYIYIEIDSFMIDEV
jgi:hypothetical protein